MTEMNQVRLDPVAANDPFGTGYKHRAFRLVVHTGDSARKVCWVLLEHDGSVSIGLSDPGIVITEVGTARIDSEGHMLAQPDEPVGAVSLSARTGPHVTLHRSGVCHVRANRETPLVRVSYGAWYPPLAALEWLHLFTSPIAAMPEISAAKVKQRDAVLPLSRTDQSLAIRVDLLPRDQRGEYPLLSGALHTAVGVAPEYAVRLSTFTHAAVHPQILLRTPPSEPTAAESLS